MKLKNILENIIIIAIILVIIHTFIYEYSIYAHWSIERRNILLLSGLAFDLLFTMEFIARSIAAGRSKQLFRYLFFERGWVDFLSSVPLLALDSGPSAYIYFTGTLHEDSTIGVLNVLKVVKAVRVTRILRLVRIIKIFGKIHNAESKMAQHHTATIATTMVFTIVCALIGFAVFTDISGKGDTTQRISLYQEMLPHYEAVYQSNRNILTKMLTTDPHILSALYNKKHVYTRFTPDEFNAYYSAEDYVKVEGKKISLIISIVDIHKRVALNHMESFFIIILIVMAIMFIYTKHFAQNISDLIHILNKGFRKKNYNLQVKIRKEFADEEIFKLAQFYNDAYLPAKLRRIHDEEKNKSALSMNDLTNFMKK